MTTTGQSASAEPSLRDQIGAAMDAVGSIDATPSPSTPSAPSAAPSTPAATPAAGTQSPATPSAQPAADAAPAATGTPATAAAAPVANPAADGKPAAAPDAPKMPPGFPGGEQAWTALPEPQRAWLKNREVQVERYIRQHGEGAKFGAAMWGAVRPYEAFIKAQGVHPAQVVEGVLGQHFRLAQGTPAQRAQVISELAAHYGVDLNEVSQQAYAPQQANPELAELRNTVQSLAQYLRTTEEQKLQAQYEGAHQTVQTFAKDPQYEYANDPEVREMMARHIESGSAQGLSHAYELAIYNVPHVRQAVLEKQRLAAANEARNQLSTAPARGGAPVGAVMVPTNESLRATIERAAAQHGV